MAGISITVLGMGIILYRTPGKITFRFQNVPVQLSVTYLLAFLVMNKPARTQIILSLILLTIAEFIYRLFLVEGFNNALVANENFGTWLDVQYGGADLGYPSTPSPPPLKPSGGGVLAGQLLMSDKTLKNFIIWDLPLFSPCECSPIKIVIARRGLGN